MIELDEMSCGELGDVAAELALGALTGRERARALAHLDECGACRERVRRLIVIGEGLLGLLPGRDPPPGFETGVLARTGGAAPGTWAGRSREGQDPGHAGTGRVASRRARGWRRVLAVAACALAAAGAGAGGWSLHPAAPPPSWPLLRSAALVSPAGHRVGQIFAYAGGSGWVYVQVDTGSGEDTVTCQVTGKGGRVTTIGAFRLADGRGAWGSPDGAGNSSLTGARLVVADGTVVATASFAGT